MQRAAFALMIVALLTLVFMLLETTGWTAIWLSFVGFPAAGLAIALWAWTEWQVRG